MRRNRVMIGLLMCLAVVSVIVLTVIVTRHRGLSASEALLVGRWTQTAPEGDTRSTLIFTSRRTLYLEDSANEGRWWIKGGQLFVQQWIDSGWPLEEYFHSLRVPAHGIQIVMDESGNIVELAAPGDPLFTVLKRDEN